MIKSEIFYEEVETNNDFAKMLQVELIKKDKEIDSLQQENETLKAKLNIGKTCGFCPYYKCKQRIDKATNYYLKELAKNKSIDDVAVKMYNLLEENINE